MISYLVVHNHDSDAVLIGLFSEPSPAYTLAAHLDGSVIPFDVDAMAELIAQGLLPWSVSFHPDGRVRRVEPEPPTVATVHDLSTIESPGLEWTAFRPWPGPDGGGLTCVWASSREDAILRAQARQRSMLASEASG